MQLCFGRIVLGGIVLGNIDTPCFWPHYYAALINNPTVHLFTADV